LFKFEKFKTVYADFGILNSESEDESGLVLNLKNLKLYMLIMES
jgi:hypothetical protein